MRRQEESKVIHFEKQGHHYFFSYNPYSEVEVSEIMKQMGRFANNPRLNFDRRDALDLCLDLRKDYLSSETWTEYNRITFNKMFAFYW